MKTEMNILIAGIQYYTKDVKGDLERMVEDKVEIVLLKTTSTKYGFVIEARERYRGETCMRGFVSRVDLPVILQLMEELSVGVLLARVKRANVEGSHFCVSVEVPEGFVPKPREADKIWDGWSVSSCPLLDMSDEMVKAEEAFTLLSTGLRNPGMFDDEYIVENLQQLIDATRYDVSFEAQEALVWCRSMVVDYPSFAVQDYYDHLVHAINGLGSQKRVEEFNDIYLERLYASEQMREMLQTWYEGMGVCVTNEERVHEIMVSVLNGVTKDLLSLPEGLGSDINNFGMLMHRLVYRSVSRKTLLMVLSAAMMRIYLMNELEVWLDGSMSLTEEPEDAVDDVLVDQLLPIFWGERDEAQAFAEKVRGMKNVQITALVREKVKNNIISEMSSHRQLWSVLYNAGIYTASESNWNMKIRN